MEESKAIHRLAEAQDLVGMVEEMLGPDMIERLSPAALSGLRITLRGVREIIGNSHAVMASDLVQRAKATTALSATSPGERPTIERPVIERPMRVESAGVPSSPVNPLSDTSRGNAPLSRRDLKASLERLVDR